ncbi:r3H and coiled-coil domain-containing protein [Planoprotostelium fungivorum]|uniref:R3H and coiled-coil domain-containing protein n=1 Tax=Planoprotostelium fungivorum TaxID=1890364 RepID=A0A2P6NIQ0_9EUKA|nr:r3H and coiled-coil domain-containing protein [Planoprotostelium fungivorum]PRP83843.1 r3H and coiled-coil domain-containing protein [Planoprotostelium fungivorum]
MSKRPDNNLYIPKHRRGNNTNNGGSNESSPTKNGNAKADPRVPQGSRSTSSPSLRSERETPPENLETQKAPITISVALPVLISDDSSAPGNNHHTDTNGIHTSSPHPTKIDINSKRSPEDADHLPTTDVTGDETKGREDTQETTDCTETSDWESLADEPPVEEFTKMKVSSARKGRGAHKYDDEDAILGEDTLDDPPVRSSNLSNWEDCTGTPTNTKDRADHVIELYGFPESLVTEDFHRFLRDYQDLGYKVKWVDETHLLVVFKSPSFAQDALKSLKHADIKLRPFHSASEQSKSTYRATQPGYFAYERSSTPRPQTTTSVARRLIGNALSIESLLRDQDEKKGRTNTEIDDMLRKKKGTTTTSKPQEPKIDYWDA